VAGCCKFGEEPAGFRRHGVRQLFHIFLNCLFCYCYIESSVSYSVLYRPINIGYLCLEFITWGKETRL
jgi:hypothetical protein